MRVVLASACDPHAACARYPAALLPADANLADTVAVGDCLREIELQAAESLDDAAVAVHRDVAQRGITVIAIQFAGCFAGAVLTENVFAWPGMGTMITSAIDNRDYSLIQATVLVVAIAFVVINLITDLLYMVINPKVAAEAKKGANNV